MSYSVTIDAKAVQAKVKAIGPAAVRYVTAAMGREAGNLLKKHFLDRDRSEPNKLGGERQHFWRDVGRSVSQPLDLVNRVEITISDLRFAHKVTGGTIKAKRVKYLTIPVIAEAYGRRAATYEKETGEKLFPIVTSGKGVLASKPDPKSKFVKVVYVLKSSVNQAADPTALPDMALFGAAVVARGQVAANRYITNSKAA